MKNILITLLLAALTLSPTLTQADYKSTPKPKHITDVAQLVSVHKDGTTIVEVSSKPGWHINCAAPLNLTINETKLDITDAWLSFPGQWANEMTNVSWTVKIAQDFPTQTATLVAAFCTESVCFPPLKETITIVKIK